MLGEPEAAGASRLAVRGVCGPATRQGVPATIPVASTGGSVGDDLAGTSSAAESGGEEEAEAEATEGAPGGAAIEVEEETGAVDTMEVDEGGDEATLAAGGRRASVCPHLWKVCCGASMISAAQPAALATYCARRPDLCACFRARCADLEALPDRGCPMAIRRLRPWWWVADGRARPRQDTADDRPPRGAHPRSRAGACARGGAR